MIETRSPGIFFDQILENPHLAQMITKRRVPLQTAPVERSPSSSATCPSRACAVPASAYLADHKPQVHSGQRHSRKRSRVLCLTRIRTHAVLLCGALPAALHLVPARALELHLMLAHFEGLTRPPGRRLPVGTGRHESAKIGPKGGGGGGPDQRRSASDPQ